MLTTVAMVRLGVLLGCFCMFCKVTALFKCYLSTIFKVKNTSSSHGMISVVNSFRIFEIIIFCYVVAIYDLVHDVETIFHLSNKLTASGDLV